jgi:NADH-quinone oxidoreductase subunit M
MLALVGGVFGVFMSRSLILMFLFIEMAVIPKFILINIWGSKNKEYAAMKYTLYLLAGNAIALIGIIATYVYAGNVLGVHTLDIATLAGVEYDVNFQKFAFLLMMVGFGVLVPMFPLHRWTPDGHSAAPTAISMLLAGVIMKLGGYALIRVGINFFPQGATFWAPVIAVLATVNAVYIGFVAMVQKDIKYVVANSSVSHMGYVLIGVASFNAASISGAAAQMFAHGIMAALFFALVGLIYDKTHTRMISDFGGLAHQMPRVAAAFMVAGLASLGLPGLMNFIAEFSVFVGSVQVYPVLAVISIFAVVITAIYILRVVQQVFFGPLTRLRTEVEADGGSLLVVLIPSKEELYGAEAYPPVLRAVREVRAGLDSLGLPTIDLYQAMRTGAGAAAPFFSRDIHFTPLGNRLVAEALADSITARRQAFRWDRPRPTASRAR